MRSTDGASEIFVKDAEVESLGTRVPLFVAAPRSQGKHPGVLVCPEIWGLTGHIKEVVCRFAAQGYVACALEIFSRNDTKGASTRYSDRLKMHVETAEKDTVADAQAAFHYLRALPVTESSTLATVGFSMGGRLAGIVASMNPEVFGCVVFYGHIYREPQESVGRTWVLDLVPRLSCPTLFIYGDDDEWNSQSHIELLRTRIKECNLPSELIVYPGSSHSFFNDEGKAFNPAAAADAWGRVLDFLDNHMPMLVD